MAEKFISAVTSKEKGPLPNANDVYVGPETLLLANAIDYGDGGEIIVWSNSSTQFYGEAQAKGGAQYGNGGFIETSGKRTLDIAGARIDASAVNGKGGVWLLDPINFIIDDSIAANFSNDLNNGMDVIVTTSGVGVDEGDITFLTNAFVNWSTDSEFSLFADDDIIFQNNSGVINSGGGTFNAHAGGDLSGNGTVIPFDTMTNHVNFTNGGAVNFYYNPPAYNNPTDYSQNVLVTNGSFIASMLINNNSDLQNISQNPAGDYALATDLDLSSIPNFTPIAIFAGRLDGQNYTISNLTINQNSPFVGLF